MSRSQSVIPDVLDEKQDDILKEWMSYQLSALKHRELADERELHEQSRRFLALFRDAVQSGRLERIDDPAWAEVKEHLDSVSRARARQGFSPSETATFVFSLKQAL